MRTTLKKYRCFRCKKKISYFCFVFAFLTFHNIYKLFFLSVFLTVLVAHGGFQNDFMMLQSNLDRHEVGVDVLKKFHFADTYFFAGKVIIIIIDYNFRLNLSFFAL